MSSGNERRGAKRKLPLPRLRRLVSVVGIPHRGSDLPLPGTRRIAAQSAAILLVAALAWLLPACGISGGSIPTGTSRLAGRVVSATSPQTPLANSIVRVSSLMGTHPTVQQVTTGADGNFNFPAVVTGNGNTTVQVQVSAPNGTFQTFQWSFLMTKGQPETLIASLAPSSVDVTQVKTVTISPSTTSVQVGDTARITAQVLDVSGNVLSLTPSLFFDGDFGTISGDGLFTGTTSGTGTITAVWYDNQTSSTARVISDKNTPAAPPPAPPDTSSTGNKQTVTSPLQTR